MKNRREHDVETDMKLKLRQFFEREDAKDKIHNFFYSKRFSNQDDDYYEEEEEEEECNQSSDIEIETTEPVIPSLKMTIIGGTAFDVFLKQDGTTIKLDINILNCRHTFSYIRPSQKFDLNIEICERINNDPIELIKTYDPIKFCISTDFPKNQFIGLATFDWRTILVKRSLNQNIEIIGLCNEIVGILQISFALIGVPDFEGIYEPLKFQRKQEKIDAVETEREFSKSMRIWWLDLMRLVDKKNIEITSKEIGSGRNIIFNQITPFSMRGLNTPGKCLRYCHLLTNLIAPLGYSFIPNWATIASRSGREREKLNVLVSLLRGFGLDAYVVVSKPRPIAVCLNDHPIFFDVVTGKFGDKMPKVVHTISYIYNEKIMLANLYPNKFDWDIKSPLKWKSLYPPEWNSNNLNQNLPLRFHGFQGVIDEQVLEIMVKKIIEDQRKAFYIDTVWSYEISEVLMPIAASYEIQKQIGKNIENFSGDAIKRVIQPFHTLKAIPVLTNTCDPLEIFRALMDAKSGLDILGIKEKSARFALRICCTQYPEGVVAVWTILAVECLTPVRLYK
ncbi:hypothetical protein TRFO_32720 [Tritrichomonas foetus]|uniref:Centrosomal protein of 76 kDa C-terminal domain-containing protein n=1 Tax=Tritrichomonas foetus TaxID=1144522 RepID=A0A1J4JNF0_9EUKA|nr:hypothetical protein TRFO_32720 [Tritrichomonas foetus]|eukprot:OHT00603.1 hypothetical protein TRFO_32720 [Tritrichomonas foetus]